MSVRTIIEINHDYLHELLRDPAELIVFIRSLGYMSESALKDREPPGIKFLAQRYHYNPIDIHVD